MVSRYIRSDLLCTQLARIYANALKKTFFVAVGDHPGFDIVSEDQALKIEVKAERTPSRTGFCAFEIQNTDLDRPSGIAATEANLWTHVVFNGQSATVYEFSVGKLRSLVMEHGKVKSSRNSRFKLLPLALVRKHAQRVFTLTEGKDHYVLFQVSDVQGEKYQLGAIHAN